MYRRNLIKLVMLCLLFTYSGTGTVTAQSYKGHSSTFTIIEKIDEYAKVMTRSQDYLFTTDRDGLINVFDIRSPGAIVHVGEHLTIDISDMDIEDSILCVAARDSGLIIFDVSDPQNFIRTGHVYLPDYTRSVEVSGNFAYLSSEEAPFNVIDISDPYNPVLTGTADIVHFAWSMDAMGDYVYCGDTSFGLEIVDVSDPYNPVIIGSYENGLFSCTYSIIVSGKYVYSYDNYSLYSMDSILRIYDVENPASPVLLSQKTLADDGIFNKMAKHGDYLFIPGYHYGVNVYDVGDPSFPELIEVLDTPESEGNVILNCEYMYIEVTSGFYVCSSSLLTGTGDSEINRIKPLAYSLAQNYPNPFNPVTTIKYELPKTEYVTLTVYNITGQVVKKLVDRTVEAGYHEAIWDASKVASGVYIYKQTARSYTSVKRMLLVK